MTMIDKLGLARRVVEAVVGVCFAAAFGLAPVAAQSGVVEMIDVQDDVLYLEKARGRLIRLPAKVSEIIIADPGVADVKVITPTLLYMFGESFGETTFFALDRKKEVIYSSRVMVQHNLQSIMEALVDYYPDGGIEVSKVGGLIILQGTVPSAEDAELAQRLVEGILVEATTSQNQGGGGGRGGQNRSLTALEQDYSAMIVNRLVIAGPSQVNLRVRFAEVSRSMTKELGVSWDNLLSNSGGEVLGLTSPGGPFVSTASSGAGGVVKTFQLPTAGSALWGGASLGNFDLNFVIDALQDEGFISLLAEPNLTTISGEEADFLAGGRFPIPVPQGGFGAVTIQYEEFGVGLRYKPTVLNSGRIRLEVSPQVSDLNTAGGVSIDGFSIPAISTRETNNVVELGSGESLAIAGLMQSRITKTADKIPGLGDLPIIGALFRSESFRNSETELLIVVTPYLVRPVSDRRILLPTDGYITPSDADRILRGHTWRPQASTRDYSKGTLEGASLRGRAGFQLN